MTVHVLFVDPPRPGLALPELVGGAGLDADAAATLAGAMLKDAAVGVANSGGELLVNHPTEEQLPADRRTGTAPDTELCELLGDALGDLDDVRFEPQVGEDREARMRNALAHLLEEGGTDSVALLDGRAPTLDRPALDGAAMKLRRSAVVLGPAPGGRLAYLGLTEPLDIDGLADPFSLEAVVECATEAGFEVDFLPLEPTVHDEVDLATLVSLVRARRTAGRRVPQHTAAAIEALDL